MTYEQCSMSPLHWRRIGTACGVGFNCWNVWMSASKCLTEINKVQSFLKQINDKMADAIFFTFFSRGVGRGSCIFKVTNIVKNCRQLTRLCEDLVHLELSCVVGYCLVTYSLYLLNSRQVFDFFFNYYYFFPLTFQCKFWCDVALGKICSCGNVSSDWKLWGGNERPSIFNKIVSSSSHENPTCFSNPVPAVLNF